MQINRCPKCNVDPRNNYCVSNGTIKFIKFCPRCGMKTKLHVHPEQADYEWNDIVEEMIEDEIIGVYRNESK